MSGKISPLHRITELPDRLLLLLIFLYPLLVGLLIQLVLLPYFFPSFHVGYGLLIGIDARQFHHLAVLQYERILTEGWQAWTLAPNGQVVSGIASAFYAILTPQPWVLLPLNAFLYTLSGWTLLKIFRLFLVKREYALLAILPFLFYPSSLTWVAQLHNDNYAVPGILLLCYGWVYFARKETWTEPKTIASAVVSFFAGGILVWLVRVYVIEMFAAVGAAGMVFLIILFLSRRTFLDWSWKRTIQAIGIVSISFIAVASIGSFKLKSTELVYKGIIFQEDSISSNSEPTKNTTIKKHSWSSSSWLPGWIDKKMSILSDRRTSAIKSWTNASGDIKGSNIDTDIFFDNAGDILRYLPRSIQIGFLAPFPTDWIGQGSKAPNTIMRRISGLEMVVSYIIWFGLPFTLWFFRKRPELWIMAIFCTSMLLIYVMGTPNIGSLYRFRFPFVMPLLGLGVAGWIMGIKLILQRPKKSIKVI